MNASLGSKYSILLLVFLLLTPAYTLRADVIYVDAAAAGANNGSSWTNAYNYLQDALWEAEPNQGIQIWVAQGSYKPDANTSNPGGTNDRTATFQLKNGVTLYGGFPTGGGSRDPNTYVTILSGDINVPDNNSDNSYHVVTGSGTDSTAVLDGFTITKGYADGSYPHYCGAGMFNYAGSPTLTNCIFTGNKAESIDELPYGGGMYNEDSNPTLTNCTFSGNQARGDGGGIFNNNSSPNLTGCTFSGNQATSSGDYIAAGGGMYNWNSSNPMLTNCVFSGNSADSISALEGYGGGMCNGSSSPTLNNCTFSSNQAYGYSGYGGGMYNSSSNPTLNNCTFSENQAYGYSSGYGGGISNRYNSGTVVTNCILWGNTAATGPQIYNSGTSSSAVTFSDVQDGYSGTGNIDADPCFVTGPDGDYYLSQIASGQAFDSPCVDTGSDTASNLGMDSLTTRTDQSTDTGTVDMGYHYVILVRSADIYKDWHVDFLDYALLALDWLQCSNPDDSNCTETELLDGDIITDYYVNSRDLEYFVSCWLDCYVTEAADPQPSNGQGSADPNNTVLIWSAGDGAVYHDVYLGTDANAVANASHLSEEFKDTVSETSFDPNILDTNTTYYWRIDEIGPACEAKGDVWSFKTWNDVIDPNLAGWWRFDEGSGTLAYDSAGDNGGTLTGDPCWVAGQINGALSFDGVDDYVDMSTAGELDFERTDTFTLSAWYKGSSSSSAILSKMDIATQCRGYDIFLNGGYVEAHLVNAWSHNAICVYGTLYPVANSLWHHIAVTYDGSSSANGLKIYVDGMEETTSASHNSLSSTIRNSVSFKVASRSDGAGTINHLNGLVDDVRVYDRVLSAAAIWQLYQDGL